MSSSNSNGNGNGQNGYFAGFGSSDNVLQNSQRNTVGHFPKVNLRQQQSYYPAINPNAPNAPNPRFLNHQGQQHPQVYNYGLRNIAPQTVNQSNQYNNFEQRQLHPQHNAQLLPARQILHSRFQHPSQHHHQKQQQFSSRRYLSAHPQSIMLDHQHLQPPQHYLDPNSQPVAVHYNSNQFVYQPQGINQISNDSPQNFQVPSITPTQNSNESDPLGVNNYNLLDLSSPQYSAAVTVQQKYRKPLEETNDEELAEELAECNFDPEFPMTNVFVAVNETYQTFDDPSNMLNIDNQQQLDASSNVGTSDNLFLLASEEDILPRHQQSSPTVNLPQIPLEESDMEEEDDETENVEANEVSAPPSLCLSASDTNPVGRPPIYENDEQRQEAHRIASRISYRICRARNADYLRNLKAMIEEKESENGNLRQRLTVLKDAFFEILNLDSGFFTQEELDWALNIFNQNSK